MLPRVVSNEVCRLGGRGTEHGSDRVRVVQVGMGAAPRPSFTINRRAPLSPMTVCILRL